MGTYLRVYSLGVVPLHAKWLRRGRSRVLGERTVAVRAEADFSNTKYGELVANLPVTPISPAEKDALLSSLSLGQDNLHVFT